MNDVSEQMRRDWNQRAREDAHYYVAFGGRQQDEEAFSATAASVLRAIEAEFKRLPPGANRRAWRALEIGCGPGRLLKPLSRHFGEIHGVDVSDEMIALARQRLKDVRNAHVHATDGSTLDGFADESFDFIYSYAVFQHIPSREVVLQYAREVSRLLKPGGIFFGQFNGLPPGEQPDTWSGVSFSDGEIREFTLQQGLQLLAIQGAGTQYMWTTWRKTQGEQDRQAAQVSIRRVTNASSSETVVPDHGPFAAISVWVLDLREACDLNSLDVRINGRSGTVVYIGPTEADGLRQVNVMLPANTRTGLLPLKMLYRGSSLSAPFFFRVIPAGPLVPRLVSITDGIDLVEENRCTSGLMKMQIADVQHPESISALVDGSAVEDLRAFCTDPLGPRYEINFRLPERIRPGVHELQLLLGSRRLLPRTIEVVARELPSTR